MKNKSKKEIYPGIGAIKLLIVSDLRYVKLKKSGGGGGGDGAEKRRDPNEIY